MDIAPVSKLPIVDLAIDTLRINKQALIFVNAKRSAQKAALDIAKVSKNHIDNKEELAKLAEQLLKAVTYPTEQCKKLSEAVSCGVAFHHAGLAGKQKTLIEDAFRAGTLKLIASTPTLAAGLDMPAFRAIIKDLKRFANWGMQFIPVLEYKQMAGRAGRPGKEDYGEAIILAASLEDAAKLRDTYIHGDVESIYSKLAVEPVLRTYVLSLVATGLCRSKSDLITFFSKSFWAHQYKDMPQIERIIERVVDMLKEYTFISGTAKKRSLEFETADSLAGNDVLQATALGVRVSQLYIDPLSANKLLTALQKEELTVFGTLHAFCSTLEMRPLLRVKARESEEYNTVLFTNESQLLVPMPTMYDPEYEEFFDAIKTTSFFSDWVNEIGEDSLLKKYDIRPGEINAKVDNMDWLLYCAYELVPLVGLKQHQRSINKLRKRVKYGVKEELLQLLQLKQVGKIRSRKLVTAGYATLADVRTAPLGILQKICGEKIAISIKEQLGVSTESSGSLTEFL
ncbi:MAG: helicase [Candidatus Woesearchaeota archaeon]|jgi:helicase